MHLYALVHNNIYMVVILFKPADKQYMLREYSMSTILPPEEKSTLKKMKSTDFTIYTEPTLAYFKDLDWMI